MIQVHIIGLKRTPVEGTVVLLQEEDESGDGRILPIWIGRYEAGAIEAAMQGVQRPRPMTHDLLQNILDEVGVAVLAIEITEMRDRTYFAEIIISTSKEVEEGVAVDEYLRISSRPSDAIALAVRVECPIVVTEEIMDEATFRASEYESGGLETGELSDEDMEQIIDNFKVFLDEVKPQDFEKPEDPRPELPPDLPD